MVETYSHGSATPQSNLKRPHGGRIRLAIKLGHPEVIHSELSQSPACIMWEAPRSFKLHLAAAACLTLCTIIVHVLEDLQMAQNSC